MFTEDEMKEAEIAIENARFDKSVTLILIKELEKHIEHPRKPGYKRHDILDRIDELKESLK